MKKLVQHGTDLIFFSITLPKTSFTQISHRIENQHNSGLQGFK